MMAVGGLRANDAAALHRALLLVEASGSDIDRDGMGDIDELRLGRNPNIAGSRELCVVTYGCGARIAPPNDSSSAALLGTFTICAMLAALRVSSGLFSRRTNR